MSHLDWEKPKRKVCHLQWDGESTLYMQQMSVIEILIRYEFETFFKSVEEYLQASDI